MVTTGTGDHSAAPSRKSRSKNVRWASSLNPGPTVPPLRMMSCMQLHQDSASLVHNGDCPMNSTRHPLAVTDPRLCASSPHEIPETANPGLQMSAYSNTLESSVHSFQESASSGLGESFVHNAQEPVESGLEESSDSQQTQCRFPLRGGDHRTRSSSRGPDHRAWISRV